MEQEGQQLGEFLDRSCGEYRMGKQREAAGVHQAAGGEAQAYETYCFIYGSR